ncbi:MAG: metallophosphoesterase, partial [Rikenellaceae bacterium]|nr:metallophosphoesterase [Rikenellaceae bacterium]
MTAWIADNRDSLNIRAVLCTGDLVDQNECLVPPFPRFGNQTSRQQWEAVSRAFARLDHRIPYLTSTGNHDYGYTRAENDMTRFPEYFPIERNIAWGKTIVSIAHNRRGYPTLETAAMEITAPHWGKLLVIVLEFALRDEVLDWAREFSESEAYRDHTVFVLIHSYLGGGADARRIESEGYKIQPANSGEQVWRKLIYPCGNIWMVLCGHHAVPDESFVSNTGFRTDRNAAGKEVHQMMFNAQALGGGMSGNGGDGWLRILEFLPDGQTIRVTTYSPLFGFSPRTKHLAWSREACNEFEMIIR